MVVQVYSDAMLAFEDIKPGARLRGLDSAGIAEVVQVSRFGADALNLVFRVHGRVAERLQITAVYGEMLPRQPLRFLLADDPGAGKTIMAGLLVGTSLFPQRQAIDISATSSLRPMNCSHVN